MPRHKVGSELGRRILGVFVSRFPLSTRTFLSSHAPASSLRPSNPPRAAPAAFEWRKALYAVNGEHRRKYSDSYRDRPLEDGCDWAAAAQREKAATLDWEREGRPPVKQ